MFTPPSKYFKKILHVEWWLIRYHHVLFIQLFIQFTCPLFLIVPVVNFGIFVTSKSGLCARVNPVVPRIARLLAKRPGASSAVLLKEVLSGPFVVDVVYTILSCYRIQSTPNGKRCVPRRSKVHWRFILFLWNSAFHFIYILYCLKPNWYLHQNLSMIFCVFFCVMSPFQMQDVVPSAMCGMSWLLALCGFTDAIFWAQVAVNIAFFIFLLMSTQLASF